MMRMMMMMMMMMMLVMITFVDNYSITTYVL